MFITFIGSCACLTAVSKLSIQNGFPPCFSEFLIKLNPPNFAQTFSVRSVKKSTRLHPPENSKRMAAANSPGTSTPARSKYCPQLMYSKR